MFKIFNKSYTKINPFALIILICFSFVFVYLYHHNSINYAKFFHIPVPVSDDIKKVPICANIKKTNKSIMESKHSTKTVTFDDLMPKCKNLLFNLTNGFWKLNDNINKSELLYLIKSQAKLRQEINFPAQFWRKDGKCGKNVPLYLNSKFASICNPKNFSCCTDITDSGKCIQTDSWNCKCNNCFDSASIVFPLLSKWITKDKRCLWQNFTSSQACFLLNNAFDSKEIYPPHFHFFGDSLLRNMYMGLLILLTGRMNTGVWKLCLTEDLKEMCYGPNQFYYYNCLTKATSYDINEIDDGLMCGEQSRAFNVTFKPYFSTSYKNELLQYVSSFIDKPNHIITIGIGVLEKFNAKVVLDEYLKPLVKMIKTSKTGWPKILWVQPLQLGNFVTKDYWYGKHNEDVDTFIKEIDSFLEKQDIPAAFNFRKLTTGIHTHDGTHYGVGLNVMKIQIWLNYIASIFLTR